LTECFQERTFRSENTKKVKQSCRPDQKRRVFLGNEKGFFVSTRGAWARTCEQAGLTECFQERTFRSENTKKAKQSCRPDQKRRVFLGNEKGFFVPSIPL
jgi:hypothetical protein